jgi:general secretion pathway protein B
MSFILKALQKVEEEKSARRSKPQDINRAILTAGTPPPMASRILPVSAVAALIALAVGSLAYLFWPTDPGPLRQAAPTRPPRESRADAPRLPSTDPSQPAPAAGKIISPGPSAAAAQSPAKSPHVEGGPQANAQPAVGQPTPAARPRTERPGPEVTYGPPPGLKVNGIALQDNPAESVAVVNGQLVHRGMVIQGMKVEEILADRVRFTGGGRNYEISISK